MAYTSNTTAEIRKHCNMTNDYPSDATIEYWTGIINGLIIAFTESPNESVAKVIEANKILKIFLGSRGKNNQKLREQNIPLLTDEEKISLGGQHKRTTITRSVW